ncbi:hypothetical protein FOA52_015180 [Chlamydomonas sp. UWO 241]|nr:hypothetical protein FOA52_015180 [Chlamydomonas sp. UWO 241]
MLPRARLRQAVALLAALLFLTSAYAGTVTTDCVAGLVRDVLQATSDNTSDDDKYTAVVSVVNDFVSSCTDGFDQSSSGLRPLRILAPYQARTDMTRIISDFQSQTGYKVIMEYIENLGLVQELQFVASTSPLAYDGWFVDGSAVVDLVTTTKLVAPLDAFISHDSVIEWSDVTQYVREITSTYGGVTIGVPIGGKPVSMQYRMDLLAAANISLPNTWEDMVKAAQILNSTDFNGDGTADYALCWQLADCTWDGQIGTSQILATMTQTTGPKTGFLWDPKNMELLGGAAAMTRTMELIQELLPYSATSCEILNPHFMSGACAITIAFESLFKGVSLYTSLKSVIGTALVPGSTRVLNRQTGQLEECTPTLCPLAVLERTYNGSMVLVNRAPHFGIGSFSGFVNAYLDNAHKQATYNLWSFLSEPIYSKELVMTTGVVGPYRKSHLDTSAQSLAAWGAIGYDTRAVTDFLTTIKGSLEHANFVPDLRMLGGSRYLATLYSALQNASAGMAPAQIATYVAAEHNANLASSGPLVVVQRSLQAGLGILVASPPPPVLIPTTAPTAQAPVTQAGTNDTLAIILGVVIPLAVIFSALLIILFIVRYRRRSPYGGHWVPSPGDDTTLVVTDIMDSTPLWETLAPGVMECAVATHNAVVRQAVDEWNGYEQATEGDSFLLAFFNPSDALGFAMQLQTSLLEAAWEPELLQHPLCTPVKMGPSAALQGAGNSDGRFGLLRAARLLGPSDGTSGQLSGVVSMDFQVHGTSWDDDAQALVPPDLHSTLGAVGSAVEAHRTTRRGSFLSVAPLFECNSGNAASRFDHEGGGLATEAVTVEPDPARTCWHSVRELLQALHAAATGDGMPTVESSESLSAELCILPRGDTNVASTMAKFMQLAWTSEGSPAAVKDHLTVFKGLRVRVGMHSGVPKGTVERNATSGRVFLGGMPLALAKAVGDAGAGGMVLLTQESFERVQPDRALKGVLVLALGEHGLKDDLGTVCVYQAIERSLVPRLAAFEPMRGLSEIETGVMDAPIGTVTIAFANMVGLTTLQTWDKDQADVALGTFSAVSKQLLHDVGGYLVELTSSGLCLAAFCHPLDAIAWGAGLIEVMKYHTWGEELLSHELCEEVLLHEPSCKGASTALQSRLLFRGPRIKIGIDMGQVQADVSPVSGRMTYRGRVMNRAARISGKASAGMQWCSTAVWEQANGPSTRARVLAADIRGTQLGTFPLKGVAENVKLVQCSWHHDDAAVPAPAPALAPTPTPTPSPSSLPLS